MGIFFKDKKEKQAPTKATGKPQVIQPSIVPVDTAVPVSSNTDYAAHLTKVMKDNNQSGPDYLEFAAALKALEGQPIGEEQKYVFTYPTYNEAGMTTKKLVESAKHYLNVLEREKSDFEDEMIRATQTQVDGRKAQIDSLQKEIENLTKQIQEKSIRVSGLNQEMNSASMSLGSEKMAFEAAYSNQVALINQHIINFEKYLPYVKSTSK